MSVRLVYDPRCTAYRLGPGHPLRPERFSLAVELIDAWGLLDRGETWVADGFETIDDDTLRLAHSAGLIEAVKRLSIDPSFADGSFGIGPGDTPAFLGMHEAACYGVATTCRAVDLVTDGACDRAFAPAGGLHHAHRERSAGFCVYNDCAIAIERAVRATPGLRVAYVDIDAHHGDGVQEAFYDRSDVLTISVHESGRYLYPGTGFVRDLGEGDGYGCAINVPMPPGASEREYLKVIDEVVAPAVEAFAPHLLVAQLGSDTHHSDPLTQLGQTVPGFVRAVDALISLADSAAQGRLVTTGGGGYTPFDATPRMWAAAFARLAGVDVPPVLPEAWLERVIAVSGGERPSSAETLSDSFELGETTAADVAAQTERAIEQLRSSSPLLG